MGAEPFLGEVMVFTGNFAPRGYALCDGSLLPISQNSALFAILGTTYGGDGRVTFGLPDMRGRTLVSAGAGPGLSPRVLGEASGGESTTLTTEQLPTHIHSFAAGQPVTATGTIPKTAVNITSTSTVNCNTSASGIANPQGGYPGEGGNNPAWADSKNGTMANDMVTTASTVTADIPISVSVSLTSGTTAAAGGSQPLSIMPPFLAIYYCMALEGIFPSRS